MHRLPVSSASGRVSGQLVEVEPGRRAPLLVLIHGGGCNSRYFDLPGFSVLQAALKRGFKVLLVDRPGHGLSPPGAGPAIASAAGAIRELVKDVSAAGVDEIFLIGHSIGGAVALTMAAERGGLRLRALAVSGIGDRPTREVRDWHDRARRGGLASEPPAELFFGPQGSYDWRGPAALRKSGEPWRMEDLEDAISGWPRRCAAILEKVDLPIHFRLAEHERVWEADPAALARIKGRLGNSPAADVAQLPAGGHLYEVHKRAPELIASQLEFLMDCRLGCSGEQ